MPDERWRIVVISTVPPVVEHLVPYLEGLGHEPVAVVSARGRDPAQAPPELHPGRLLDVTRPPVAVHFPATKWQVEPLLRAHEPDLAVCWGYPWKLPLAALEVPRLGSVNHHPGLLPRHRGPVPMAWALREGDPNFGLTWHRMDAELDTGAILAQGTLPIDDADTTIREIAPKLLQAAFALFPRVLERLAAGDPGDAQDNSAASWAGHFGEDYATVDWSQPARAIHDQVRAWHLTFGLAPVPGPIAQLDGESVRLLRTSLTDPGGGARRVQTGDGPLWVVEHDPAPR